MKTIREVLEELVKLSHSPDYWDKDGLFCPECFSKNINIAISEIEKIIVPKKKGIKGWDTSSQIYDRRVGFNQCREIMKARMR